MTESPRSNRYVTTEPFWAGLQEGKLVLQYCPEAGRYQHIPRPISGYTGKRNIDWRPVSGTGTIYANTVIRVSGGIPTRSVAIVELDEGVRIIANIVDCAPDDVAIGQRVTLTQLRMDDDTKYPAFRCL